MTTENWLIVNMIHQSSNYLEFNSLLKRPIGSRWDKIRHNTIGEKNNRSRDFQIYQASHSLCLFKKQELRLYELRLFLVALKTVMGWKKNLVDCGTLRLVESNS